jgi:phosphoribosyl 1,2-cyclic phosphate phosphodiesterase
VSVTFTILGCGSSGGVPRVDGDWGACDPANPRNRRRRCSLLIEKGGQEKTTVVIDTSPDMREQMLSAKVKHLDGVWYTHEHADHTHGIDELRGFFLKQRKRIPVWADVPTANMLMTRFAYCVAQAPGSDYPPILDLKALTPGESFTTQGAGGEISALPFTVQHGNIEALGFRVGNVAYTPDVSAIPDESLGALEGLDVWIIDALRPARHPSHLSLSEALQWIDRMQPKEAILTNMHIDLDYAVIKEQIPKNVTPAFDGLSISV